MEVNIPVEFTPKGMNGHKDSWRYLLFKGYFFKSVCSKFWYFIEQTSIWLEKGPKYRWHGKGYVLPGAGREYWFLLSYPLIRCSSSANTASSIFAAKHNTFGVGTGCIRANIMSMTSCIMFTTHYFGNAFHNGLPNTTVLFIELLVVIPVPIVQ